MRMCVCVNNGRVTDSYSLKMFSNFRKRHSNKYDEDSAVLDQGPNDEFFEVLHLAAIHSNKNNNNNNWTSPNKHLIRLAALQLARKRVKERIVVPSELITHFGP